MKRSTTRSVVDCFICNQPTPQQTSESSCKKTLPRRGCRKSNEVLWIQCDVCKKWLHPECCGLTEKDYTKLIKDGQFFKCVLCYLKSIPEHCQTQIQYIADKDKDNVHTKKEQPPRSNSLLSEPSTSTPKFTAQSKDSNKSSKKQSNSEVSKETVSPTHKRSSSFTGLSHQPQENLEATGTEYLASSERDNIIIVDSIPNAAEFTHSSRILKEINLFAPDVSVKFAYSLARGGVAIHVHSQQDKVLLLQSFTREAFGGAKIYDLGSKTQTLFVKGVSSSVPTNTLREAFRKKHIEVLDLSRITQHRTGRPLPVVKITCSVDSASSILLCPFITVNGIECKIERKRVEVFRCYNCHQFGHIARSCKFASRCVNCSQQHP